MSTVLLAAVFLGCVVLQLVLWGAALRIGLRWAKVADVRIGRVLLATMLVFVVQSALSFALVQVSPDDVGQMLIFGIPMVLASLLIPIFVIMGVFKASLPRALQAWAVTIAGSIAAYALIFLVVGPFVGETFRNSGNAMAPTMLGNHWQGTCAKCGSPAFCSPVLDFDAGREEVLMICRDNFHVTQPVETVEELLGGAVIGADRFIVGKFLTPRRWDIIVYRHPEEPAVPYATRLVGLPGEEIVIKDGRVWANGKRLAVPASIRGINYLSELDGWPGELWGSPDRPAKLGNDEYFVLGDFSPRAKDSRLWEHGAAGHSPFAVPESHLVGVVTHIYWPPSRWRELR